MELLKKDWRVLALIAACGGWIGLIAGNFASSALAVILVLSFAVFGYFLFRAPLLWCGAMTRADDFYRNNCSGLLMGCQHRDVNTVGADITQVGTSNAAASREAILPLWDVGLLAWTA
jgi:hypothetical protein